MAKSRRSLFGIGEYPLTRIIHEIKQDARSFACPTIPIRIHDNPIFVIDSHFEKYYTHPIEVTPSCAYFMEYPVLSSEHTRICPRVFFIYSLKQGD